MKLDFRLTELHIDDFSHLTWIITTIADGWHDWSEPDPTTEAFRPYFEAHPELIELVTKSYLHSQAYGDGTSRVVEIYRAGGPLEPENDIYPLDRVRPFISQPLDILVENEISDGHFYKRFLRAVDPDLAELFDLPIAPVRFYQGGGVTEITHLVEHRTTAAKYREIRTRILAIADSDSKYPGHRNAESNALARTCTEHRVPWHLTRKRAQENYIPDPVFHHAAATYPDLEVSVAYILELTSRQRDHYPIKAGLPSSLTHGEASLYSGVQSPVDSAPMKVKRIAEYFRLQYDREVLSSDLAQRDCIEEFRELAEMIRKEL